jgi:tetratricopeptide (TPR) repeat protein
VAWTFTREELEADRDAAAAEVAEYPNKVENARLGRALRWLDDEVGAREAFRGGAIAMKTNVLDRGRLNNAVGWAEYGDLLHNAGDEAAAREQFQRALDELADEQSVRAAKLRYHLGLAPGRAPKGPFWERTLAALASREGLDEARDAVVKALRAERALPSYNGSDMTLWDLLEETFRVEAERDGTPLPDHATMLARTGLMGEPEPAPELDPPRRGRWTVGEASIEQGDRGPVKATLSPRLWLEFTDLRLGKWDVTLYDAKAGKLNESGPFDGFGAAVDAAKDALRSEADGRAVATLDALVRAYSTS